MIGEIGEIAGSQAVLRVGRQRWRAMLGAAGICADKHEGDNATPVGRLALRRVLWRADRLPAPVCAVPRSPLAPADGWCDDPAHEDYNRAVQLPHPGRHEALWRQDAVYDVIGVLGWNDAPVVPGRGSAIFLHLLRPDRRPTEGCIALERDDLLAALAAGLTAIDVPAV